MGLEISPFLLFFSVCWDIIIKIFSVMVWIPVISVVMTPFSRLTWVIPLPLGYSKDF